MKNSKTTIKELTARYSAILRKCAFLNAVILAGFAFATPALAKDLTEDYNNNTLKSISETGTDDILTGQTIALDTTDTRAINRTTNNLTVGGDNTESITINTANNRTVQISGGTTKIIAKDIKITNTNTVANQGRALYALSDPEKSHIIVGDENTENVTISSQNDHALIALNWSDDGYKNAPLIDVKGKNITISTQGTGSYAVHAGDRSTPDTKNGTDYTTVNMTGTNINISAPNGYGVSAMSQGIVNITGNTTITAPNAILARGYASVNINKDTTAETAKIDGNIKFDYDKGSSGTSVDAYVDITLNGSDSYWKGNTFVSWDEKPTESFLEVNNATLTMNDGAKWTATNITDNDVAEHGSRYTALNNLNLNNGTVEIQDLTRGIIVDNVKVGDGIITGGPLNITKQMDITGTLTLADGSATIKSENGTINFADGSSLKTNLLANASSTALIEAAKITGKTSLVFANGDSEGQVQLKGANAGGFTFNDNALYNITNDETNNDIFIFTRKSADEISSGAGLSNSEAAAIIAASQSTVNNPVLEQMTAALQSGDTDTAKTLASAINPTEDAAKQVAANTNAIGAAVLNRLFASGPAMVARPAQNGRSGGDIKSKLAPWVQGLYTKTHNTQAAGFDAYSRGFAFGVDSDITNAVKVGIGYAYTATDIKSNRKTQVYGDNYFVYGQYKPHNWYVNGMFSYGHANYKEATVATTAKYNVDNYAAQIMTGYDYGIANNYAGVRYNYIDTETYNNGVADIKTKNAQIGTLVIGTKISKDFKPARNVLLTPEFRLAGTYDVKSDNNSATVAVMGASSTYSVTGERLSRGAIEAGVGLTANIKRLELSLGYDTSVRKRNFSQGGMVKAKYNF